MHGNLPEIISEAGCSSRVLCDKTKQYTADILIPLYISDTNIGWWATSLPFEICGQITHPFQKMPISTDFRS